MKHHKTVFVIDDDHEFLDEFSEILTAHGYNTLSFSNGNSALDQLKMVQPDLICLDLKMDKISGYDVMDELVKNEKTKQIPVMIITGNHDLLPDQNNGFHENVKVCLIKPVFPEDVLNRIDMILL